MFEDGTFRLFMPLGAVSFAVLELGCVSSVCCGEDNRTIWLVGQAMHKCRACLQDDQPETSPMASPERATRQRNIPSLSPLNIARQLSPPAPSPSHLASEVPCPVPHVEQHHPVTLGAINDLNADSDHSVGVDHSGDSDFDEQHNGNAECLGQPDQAEMTAARLHSGSVPQGAPCDPLEDLDSSDQAMSEEECDGATAENSQSRAQAVHHHSAGAGGEAGDAHVAEREEEPSRVRQHSASRSALESASESVSLEAEAAAGPSRLHTAVMQSQDEAEPMRQHWAAGPHLSSEGQPDSPGGEAELPEEGWMWYSASLLTCLYC